MRSGEARSSRRSWICLTKINKVTVKHHCSNIVILMKLLVNEGDSRDARRCIVELACCGPRCFGLQVQEARHDLQVVLYAVI